MKNGRENHEYGSEQQQQQRNCWRVSHIYIIRKSQSFGFRINHYKLKLLAVKELVSGEIYGYLQMFLCLGLLFKEDVRDKIITHGIKKWKRSHDVDKYNFTKSSL